MSAIFITATGTEIGKTYVAAGLIRHLRGGGRPVDAIKPVVTGFDPETAETSDPGVLLAALGRPAAQAKIERVSPWRYAAPLSPDMAAKREGKTIDFEALVTFSRNAISARAGTLLIEGIGGVMVPLDRRHTVLDWIVALEVATLVVTGSYLGSLSHTLTCLDALQGRGVAIKALVVNETPGSTVPLADTVETLQCFAGSVPVVPMRRMRNGDVDHPAIERIAGLF
jgi:dethiobiotin synthetase